MVSVSQHVINASQNILSIKRNRLNSPLHSSTSHQLFTLAQVSTGRSIFTFIKVKWFDKCKQASKKKITPGCQTLGLAGMIHNNQVALARGWKGEGKGEERDGGRERLAIMNSVFWGDFPTFKIIWNMRGLKRRLWYSLSLITNLIGNCLFSIKI